MNGQIEKAVRNVGRKGKFLAIPAAVVAAWLTTFGIVLTAVSNPRPLHESIEKVLVTRNDAVESLRASVATLSVAASASRDDDG